MAPVFPPGSVPHYVSLAGIYPNQAGLSQSGGEAQVSSTTFYPNQVLHSVTYSGQGPPPAYQEKKQPGLAS